MDNFAALAEQVEALNDAGKYEEAGRVALDGVGGTMAAALSDTKRPTWEEKRKEGEPEPYRPHWRVTLSANGRAYTFDYFDSIKNGMEAPQPPAPSAYDILTCLTKYDPGTFGEFCAMFGYDTDSRRAESTWVAVCDEWRNLVRVFGEDALDVFQRVQ